MSFNEIVEKLNRQGHNFSYKQVPEESFAGSFPGAAEFADKMSNLQGLVDTDHSYLILGQ